MKPTPSNSFSAALRAVRLPRLVAIAVLATAAGLLSDWLRSDHRLLFPRPLPEFKRTPPPR